MFSSDSPRATAIQCNAMQCNENASMEDRKLISVVHEKISYFAFAMHKVNSSFKVLHGSLLLIWNLYCTCKCVLGFFPSVWNSRNGNGNREIVIKYWLHLRHSKCSCSWWIRIHEFSSEVEFIFQRIATCNYSVRRLKSNCTQREASKLTFGTKSPF